MAITTGIGGKATGKLGSNVYAVSSGVQIVREYNPYVSNPATEAQVEQRAKMKLMSQLAAVMAPVIAIPKDGLRSARNQWISKNYPLSGYDDETATFDFLKAQLTNGNTPMPGLKVTRAGSNIFVTIADGAVTPQDVTRAVVVGYDITAADQPIYLGSGIIEYDADEDTWGSVNIFDAATEGTAVIFVYGIRDLSANASAKFADLGIASATAVASLVANRTLNSSDFAFTQTVGEKITW